MYWRLLCVTLTGLSVARALTESPCGGKITITSAGYVTSPGYPSGYPVNQQCSWLIQAPDPQQKILINFNPHFDLESRECKYDFVQVFDGVDENTFSHGRFCGKIAPSPIISNGNSLLIKFTSDYESAGAGFSIRYEIHRTGTECSRNFTETNGVIQTPGFPDKYPNNLECTFIIFAPKMAEIVLDFQSFDMEPDTTAPVGAVCRFDYLEIWDGYPTVGPHIGRYCGSRQPGRVISYTGILSLSIHTDNAITKEGFSANYSIRTSSDPPQPHQGECMSPLGMESGEITEDRITASSQYNPSWSPLRSRLNFPENGWTPSDDSVREWIQVDLGFLRYVTAIGTQGAISKETKKAYYVKTYKISVSSNGEDWIILKDKTKHMVFHGNQNPTDEVRARLPKPTLTRYLRIRPLSWEQGICMRFEVYGCKISDAPCSSMLGMVSGQISDSQITVWPSAERGWLPEQARLLTGRTGWVVAHQQNVGKNQSLELDLGAQRMVSGLILQGGKYRDMNIFIRRFRVTYSTNGTDWSHILEENSNKVKVFMGNQNHDTPEVRTFDPVLMRLLRIYPERGSPEGMALRLEVLGCDLQEPTTPLPLTTTMETTVATVTSAPGNIPTTTIIPTTVENCDDEGNCRSEAVTDYATTETAVAEPFIEMEAVPAYIWFACDFGWADNPSYCGWSQDGGEGAEWHINNNSKHTDHKLPNLDHTGMPHNFIYAASNTNARIEIERKTETETDEELARKGGVARLASLPVTAPDSDLCMSFWYHFTEKHTGTLNIKQKIERLEVAEEEREDNELLIRSVNGQMKSRWREGRVLIPSADTPYQVILEAQVDPTESGCISLDDIKILDEMDPEACKNPDNTEGDEDEVDEIVNCEGTDNTLWSFGRGSMLKSLDPILITIIVMSAVGVLLGAVCGVLFYCACAHTTNRNLSALENYNFELVDGVKLKKEKLSAQKSYTEA
ncbi:neuropilin-1a-like [Sinocyclocheilus anshuiensis]|uniref:neuropilin-1a-like n=1 Tax=Sinocyclocheilus anshuiensis TaxID=1608454 RepID=UPI0007B8B634|nr:PREDICTED: neuropilin-1a-like [Sinocyclocheilus anshuiensis]